MLRALLTEGEPFVWTPNGRLVTPSREPIGPFSVLQWAVLAIVSIIGLAWLFVLRRGASPRRARRPVMPVVGALYSATSSAIPVTPKGATS